MGRAVAVALAVAAWAVAFIATTGPATAQDRCLAVANAPAAPSGVQKAALRLAQLKTTEIRITFLGHSTFQIESARGVKIATDYNDYYGRARRRTSPR